MAVAGAAASRFSGTQALPVWKCDRVSGCGEGGQPGHRGTNTKGLLRPRSSGPPLPSAPGTCRALPLASRRSPVPSRTYSGHDAASSTTRAKALRSAAVVLLRVFIPTSTPVSLPEGSLRPAAHVAYPVAAVGVKHPSLLSLGRVSLLGVTIGTKQVRKQEVLFPFVG